MRTKKENKKKKLGFFSRERVYARLLEKIHEDIDELNKIRAHFDLEPLKYQIESLDSYNSNDTEDEVSNEEIDELIEDLDDMSDEDIDKAIENLRNSYSKSVEECAENCNCEECLEINYDEISDEDISIMKSYDEFIEALNEDEEDDDDCCGCCLMCDEEDCDTRDMSIDSLCVSCDNYKTCKECPCSGCPNEKDCKNKVTDKDDSVPETETANNKSEEVEETKEEPKKYDIPENEFKKSTMSSFNKDGKKVVIKAQAKNPQQPKRQYVKDENVYNIFNTINVSTDNNIDNFINKMNDVGIKLEPDDTNSTYLNFNGRYSFDSEDKIMTSGILNINTIMKLHSGDSIARKILNELGVKIVRKIDKSPIPGVSFICKKDSGELYSVTVFVNERTIIFTLLFNIEE